jgi:hypothetical protein
VTSSPVQTIAHEVTSTGAPRATVATLRRWLGIAAVCAVVTAPMLAYAAWRFT